MQVEQRKGWLLLLHNCQTFFCCHNTLCYVLSSFEMLIFFSSVHIRHCFLVTKRAKTSRHVSPIRNESLENHLAPVSELSLMSAAVNSLLCQHQHTHTLFRLSEWTMCGSSACLEQCDLILKVEKRLNSIILTPFKYNIDMDTRRCVY